MGALVQLRWSYTGEPLRPRTTNPTVLISPCFHQSGISSVLGAYTTWA